jgi:ADP-ribose pyrophosphatase
MSNQCNIPSLDTPVEVLYAGHWLTLKHRGGWEFVERNNPSGAVIIIAVTPEDEVLFVEQFRVPIMQRTIEMPAGLVGDLAGQSDEGILIAARRELEEETGYTSEDIRALHAGPSSAGMSTEMMTFVRAHDLRRIGPGGGDESEDIIVHAVARHAAGRWLLDKAREGFSIDPKLFAGLWLLDNETVF